LSFQSAEIVSSTLACHVTLSVFHFLQLHPAGPPELGERRSPSKNGRGTPFPRVPPQFDHWLDPIPTWLLKRETPHIAPVICKLCNLSLHNGVFPIPLKQILVLPILKKNNLDLDVASSYRPISHLPYISKVIERVVARRLSSHLSHSSLVLAVITSRLDHCN